MSISIFACDHAGPTVFEDTNGYPFQTDDWAFSLHAPRALQIIQDECIFDAIVLIASHSGVARGMYTHDEMMQRHQKMEERLRDEVGVEIAATGICSHMPKAGCKCRKPGTGMFFQVADQLKQRGLIDDVNAIDLSQSVMVGDKPEDIGFGQNVGFGTTILMTSRYWNPEKPVDPKPDHVVTSLIEAAYHIRDGFVFK